MEADSQPPAASCSIHNAAFQKYRISDVLTSRFFRHQPGGQIYHQASYPRSLAASFLREYHVGSSRWHAYYANTTCVLTRSDATSSQSQGTYRLPKKIGCTHTGFCQCFVPPAAAIVDILDRESLENSTSKSSSPSRGRLSTVAAVHLRVGDVVERSPHDLHAMLSRPTSFEWSGCTSNDTACTPVSAKVYVRPLSAYAPVSRRLKALGVRTVVLLANAHARLPSYAKSCEYVARIGEYFSQRGFRVGYRLGREADDDLRFASRCAAVVPSGASGFGQLLAKVAAMRGATVVPTLGQVDRGGHAYGGHHGGHALASGSDGYSSGALVRRRSSETLRDINRYDLDQWGDTPVIRQLARRRYAHATGGYAGASLRVGLCVSGRAVDRPRRSYASVVPAVYTSQVQHMLTPWRTQVRAAACID